MDRRVVKWDIELDDSITAIGLIVGEEQPAIKVGAQYSEVEAEAVAEGDLIDLIFMEVFAEEQAESYQGEATDEALAELRANKIVAGPALIPNKLILRVDDDGNPFYGFFTEEAVRNAAYSFQKNKLIDKFNINHNQDEYIDGVFIGESWIVESDNDKSRDYGYNLPAGTWFIKLKIQNEEIYDRFVASGEVNGFSIETQLLETVIFSESGAGHLKLKQTEALDASKS